MYLGLDGNEANVAKKVGSNIYAYKILKYLNRKAKEDEANKFKVYLKDSWKTLLPAKLHNWQYQIVSPKRLWTQIGLPVQLYREKLTGKAPELFFTPGHYAPRFSPIPTVISIMDLAFLKFTDEFLKKDLEQLKNWTAYSAKNAKHIFTISNHSKKDIIENYHISEDKITVTHLGVDFPITKKESDKSYQLLARHFGIQKPYFIYIGTLQPRKNIKRLIQAFAQIKKDYQLLVVGKKGWLFESIYDEVKKQDLKDKVIFTGYVSNYEKVQLLKNSHAFILPSLYEGFGIPLLEAMKLGVPAISSKVSSLPEIGGQAITYIDNPESITDITKSLTKMIQLSESKRLQIIADQKSQAEKFSWDTCGYKAYKKLLELTKTK